MSETGRVGQEIVSAWLAGQCRWAAYSDDDLREAFRYAARMDLNKAILMVGRVMAARGILSDRDRRDLGM